MRERPEKPAHRPKEKAHASAHKRKDNRMGKTGWGPALWATLYLAALYACSMALCWVIFKATGAM